MAVHARYDTDRWSSPSTAMNYELWISSP